MNIDKYIKKTIVTNEDYTQAAEFLSFFKSKLKEIVFEKEKATKPINEGLKAIRAKYAPTIDKLEATIAELTKDIIIYNAEQAKREADILKSIEASQTDPLTAIAEISAIVTPSKVITSTGLMTFRTDKVLEITDINKIPREYLLPDLPKIKNALKDGIKIEGAVLNEIRVPVNRK